ncbi:MAG: hypothetical protein PHW46_03800 [Candidatus Omnitrophica bacterium]|nr:hypothetical protein [Candidatus Omnitrophota bacterium]
MTKKMFTHKVTIAEKRRTNKSTSDLFRKKDVSKRALIHVFNSYYKDQVKALYKTVVGDR